VLTQRDGAARPRARARGGRAGLVAGALARTWLLLMIAPSKQSRYGKQASPLLLALLPVFLLFHFADPPGVLARGLSAGCSGQTSPGRGRTRGSSFGTRRNSSSVLAGWFWAFAGGWEIAVVVVVFSRWWN